MPVLEFLLFKAVDPLFWVGILMTRRTFQDEPRGQARWFIGAGIAVVFALASDVFYAAAMDGGWGEPRLRSMATYALIVGISLLPKHK